MINNEGFDAPAHGMSALEIGVCACETVYTVINMYVKYVAYVRSLGNNSLLRFVVVWERRRLGY